VLAGAAPQVLASAAMTRQFDVKDEIEFKDDLDTKPADERSPVTASVQIYLEDVENFLANLGSLKTKGKFDPNVDTFSVAQNTLLPCVDSNLAGRYTPIRFVSTSDASRSALEYFSRGMAYGYSLGDCIPTNEFNVTAADSRFSFDLDRSAFSVKVAVKKQSPERAFELARQLQTTFDLYSTRSTDKLRKTVIEHTTFRTENDQDFVSNRLRRAGLTSLLKERPKSKHKFET